MTNNNRLTFYSDSGRHLGWTSILCSRNYLEVSNWIRSGNSIKFDGRMFDSMDELKSALNAKG